MLIHLADTSSERGQYGCLVSEMFTNHLLSYEYRNAAGRYFESTWSELVRIYLAGLPSRDKAIQVATLPGIESHLTTYADQSEVEAKLDTMFLHLTDTTARLGGGRTVKTLLPEEGKTENLFSYAYKDQEEQWRDSRSLAMNIHIAGHSATPEMEATVRASHENHLTTYADLRPRVIIDSGAFTAFTTGKTINPKDYAAWALDFKQRWESKMAALHFMNLDVIGDQDASWANQSAIEAMGLKPLPIVTYGADKRHLIRAIEHYDYIALGGLVPWSRQKDKLAAWLDYCFSIVMAHHKKTGVMPRVHLLGITTDWVLKRYPCYSSDSSSWVACLRFGGGAAAGIKQLPRYKESDGAMAATIHTLKAEIRKYKKMQDEATNLWSKRGIHFND